VMNHGRAEQVGPPHEAYERPATPFVAGFLGKTNTVRGATVRPIRRRRRREARRMGRTWFVVVAILIFVVMLQTLKPHFTHLLQTRSDRGK